MIQGKWYTPAELHELPSLGTGQADTHVGTTEWEGSGQQRVWYGRTEDSPVVSVETLNDRYLWDVTYEGNPSRVRINWTHQVEIAE